MFGAADRIGPTRAKGYATLRIVSICRKLQLEERSSNETQPALPVQPPWKALVIEVASVGQPGKVVVWRPSEPLDGDRKLRERLLLSAKALQHCSLALLLDGG